MKKLFITLLCIFNISLIYAQNVLSVGADPKPLDSQLVYDLFNRVEEACNQQNGKMLFDQFSQEIQQSFTKYLKISADNPSFSSLSHYCNNIKEINDSFISKGPKFCSMKDREKVRLCSYKEDIALVEKHGIRITFENNQLKFNEH